MSSSITELFPISELFPEKMTANLGATVGAERLYLILFTGRCGSTLLTSLVKGCQDFGNPEEFLNEEFVTYWFRENGRLNFSAYLKFIGKINSSDKIFGLEIDPLRLYCYLEEGFLSEEDIFSGKYGLIWMHREDLVAQSYSYASAKQSGRWHNFKTEETIHSTVEEGAVTDADLWIELLSIFHTEWWTEMMFKKNNVQPLRITYEQLVSDRVAVLSSVLAEASGSVEKPGVDLLVQGDLERLKYSNKHKWYADFFARNRRLINKIGQFRRECAHVDTVTEFLIAEGVKFKKGLIRKW